MPPECLGKWSILSDLSPLPKILVDFSIHLHQLAHIKYKICSLLCISVALVSLITAGLVFCKVKLAKNIWRGLAAVQKACRLWICGFLPHFFPRWEKGILQQPPAAGAQQTTTSNRFFQKRVR
jgi:hypothetical protein